MAFDQKEADLAYEIIQQIRSMGWGDFMSTPRVDAWPYAYDKTEHRVMIKSIDYAPRGPWKDIYVGKTCFEALQKLHAALPPESVAKLAELRQQNAPKIEAFKQIADLINVAGGNSRCGRYRTLGSVELGHKNWYDSSEWVVGEVQNRNSFYHKISLTFGRLGKGISKEPWGCIVEINNSQDRLPLDKFHEMITLYGKVAELADKIRQILHANFLESAE